MANKNIKKSKFIGKKPPKKVELTPKQKRLLWWENYKNIIIIMAVVTVILTITVIAIATSDNENDEIVEGQYTLLDLGSQGCPACDALEPVIEALDNKYDGEINVLKYDVNYSSKGAELGRQYNVTTIPTLVFLDRDGNLVEKTEGYKSQTDIENIFRELGWI